MPVIRPLLPDASRPFWSVLIPTYKARADYLEETLKSVLQQDPGPEQMQIEVVDDCSPDGAPVELVRRLAGDRVAVHQEPANNGLAGIWNRCIERARGEWVHILHQDDIVLPGFYDHLYRGISCNPHVGMAFCRFAIVDANGHWKELGPLESSTPGVLNNWLERVATGYHLECPAVVVKRATYERLGGFTAELMFALDLEMWVRIAANAPIYYEPQILAGFRRHGGNESAFKSERVQTCKTWLKQSKSGKIICPQIPEHSWNSRAVAIGPASHLRSLSIFSPMMMLPRAQASCAPLKLCGTTAGIVRVGYGWKRKCFLTAHWADAPYLGCASSAGEFDLPRKSFCPISNNMRMNCCPDQ